jgi:hypothetical protein
MANNEGGGILAFRDPSAALRLRQDDKKTSARQPNEI